MTDLKHAVICVLLFFLSSSHLLAKNQPAQSRQKMSRDAISQEPSPTENPSQSLSKSAYKLICGLALIT